MNQINIEDKYAIFSPSAKFFDKLNSNSNQNEPAHEAKNKYLTKNAISLNSNTSYYVKSENAQLGWTLVSADLDNDSSEDLIIGCPVHANLNYYQNGAVFVVMNKNGNGIPLEDLNLEKDSDLIIYPPAGTTRSRFGHAITSLDLNQDGFNDIVISAPSYGLENITYEVVTNRE